MYHQYNIVIYVRTKDRLTCFCKGDIASQCGVEGGQIQRIRTASIETEMLSFWRNFWQLKSYCSQWRNFFFKMTPVLFQCHSIRYFYWTQPWAWVFKLKSMMIILLNIGILSVITLFFIRRPCPWVRCISHCPRPYHDDVMKWHHFPRYWPFVSGIHRSQVDSPHNGQRSFDTFFDLRLSKRFSKQSRHRWFEMPSRSLWRHCNRADTDSRANAITSSTYQLHLHDYRIRIKFKFQIQYVLFIKLYTNWRI